METHAGVKVEVLLLVWAFVVWTNVSAFGLIARLFSINHMISLVTVAETSVIFFHACVAGAWDADIRSLFAGQTSLTVREGFTSALVETITVFSFIA